MTIPQVIGDQTLVGTQLQLISQLEGVNVVPKFQLTSAIGLETTEANVLLGLFQDGRTDEAIGELQGLPGVDQRFLAVLTAATSEVLITKKEGDEFAGGKDGFPDLRIIYDFSDLGPTATFQIHTVLSFKPGADPTRLGKALSRHDLAEILPLVNEICTVQDRPHLEAMLTAALS
jgi:hypothetical protein